MRSIRRAGARSNPFLPMVLGGILVVSTVVGALVLRADAEPDDHAAVGNPAHHDDHQGELRPPVPGNRSVEGIEVEVPSEVAERPERRAEAEQLRRTLLDRATDWRTTALAEQAGFQPMPFDDTGHWVNDSHVDDGRILDGDRPEFLIFHGEQLVGAMFLAPAEATSPPVFGAPILRWHHHEWNREVCLRRGLVVESVAIDGRCAEGSVPRRRSPLMAHIWFLGDDPFANHMAHGDGHSHPEPVDTAAARLPTEPPRDDVLALARDAGARALMRSLDDIDTTSVAFVRHIGRGYRLPELARAGASVSPEANWGRALARLTDPTAPPPFPLPADDTGANPEEVEVRALMAAALWCDRVPVDEPTRSAMHRAVDASLYGTTHVGYGLRWMEELGCAVDADLRTKVVGRLLAELDRGVADSATPTDEEIVAGAVLTFLGDAERIPAPWIHRVLQAQRVDGLWTEDGVPTWHTTSVAVWVLSGQLEPGTTPPMLAGPR